MAIRVLVVDDDPGIREVLTNFLSRRGYEVETAADGETALETIHRNKPDVLLLDIYLPTMSGLDVLYELQHDRVEIPTLTFSGMPDDKMARESTLLGASDFLYKPFNLEDLENSLQARLSEMGLGPERKEDLDDTDSAAEDAETADPEPI